MLLFRFTNQDQSVDVQYITDSYNGNDRHLIAEKRGIDGEEVRLGFKFETGYIYWTEDFKKFAEAKGLNLDLYDSQTFIGRLVNSETGDYLLDDDSNYLLDDSGFKMKYNDEKIYN